jgi:hypothetical protein
MERVLLAVYRLAGYNFLEDCILVVVCLISKGAERSCCAISIYF